MKDVIEGQFLLLAAMRGREGPYKRGHRLGTGEQWVKTGAKQK